MEKRVLSREEMEAEIRRLNGAINGLKTGVIEPTPDSAVLLQRYIDQRDYLVRALKRIDSTDVL